MYLWRVNVNRLDMDRNTRTSRQRGNYITGAVCQQFCDRTGASMPGYACTIADGRAAAADVMPAADRNADMSWQRKRWKLKQ
uniref:hypothetical protein n=1 Tax=Citrobacter freundii TaxID=546 RepID=UPI0020970A92|nr:hypothetical protein [Citrobacter freundii]URZ94093.1 hypothetical protein [Citrobacter freundii]